MPNVLSTGRGRSIEVSVNTNPPGPAQTMLRETAIALAMLAVYVLTLLLPLHQAAGLQRDLNAIGYATLDNWSVCQGLAQDESGDPREAAALTCPATGAAKLQLAAILPPAVVLSQPAAMQVASHVPASAPALFGLPDHTGQSRAPPLPV